eukprot:6607445-Prymnesium_polylepis.1
MGGRAPVGQPPGKVVGGGGEEEVEPKIILNGGALEQPLPNKERGWMTGRGNGEKALLNRPEWGGEGQRRRGCGKGALEQPLPNKGKGVGHRRKKAVQPQPSE